MGLINLCRTFVNQLNPHPNGSHSIMSEYYGWATIVAKNGVEIFTLINLVLYLCLSIGTPICFDDCSGYIVLMGRDFPGEYFQAWSTMWRSWVVPVFFSMFGEYNLSSALSIVVVQSFLLFISWFYFARVMAALFGGSMAVIVFMTCLLSAYSQQYFVLNRYLLSDSFAMSAVLIFLANLIRFVHLGNSTSRQLLVLSAVLAVGTRDSNMMVVVMGVGYILFACYSVVGTKNSILLIAVLSVILVNQIYHAKLRHQTNIDNIIAGFVLPNPDVRDFFVKHSVLDANKDFIMLNPQRWCSASYKEIIINKRTANFSEERLDIASKWYAIWLLTHPTYVLEQAFMDRECILGQSFAKSLPWQSASVRTMNSVSTRPGDKVVTIQQGVITIALQDIFSTDIKIVLGLGLCVLLLPACHTSARKYIIPSMMLLVTGLCTAISSYFADLWEPSEMLRHAFIGSVVFNFGFLMIILSACHLLLVSCSVRESRIPSD